jgi:hypothetical protein
MQSEAQRHDETSAHERTIDMLLPPYGATPLLPIGPRIMAKRREKAK